MLTVDEFAAKIKAKYPAYTDMDNRDLAEKIIAKYPQYKASVNLDSGKELAARGSSGATGDFGSPEPTAKIDRGDIAPIPEPVQKTAEFLSGAVSSVPKTALGAAQLAVPNDKFDQKVEDIKNDISIDTPAGKAGEFVGDIAQFAIPVPGGAKAKLAEKVGEVATKGIVEGAKGLGLVSAQEGELDEKAISAGIISGGLPFLGKALESSTKLAQPAREKLAGRIVNSLIKPLKKDLAYGKNPGEAIAKEGIVASNLDDLLGKISDKKNEVGKLIDDTVSSAASKVDTSSVLQPLDDAISAAKKSPRTNSTVISRLENARDDLLDQYKLGEISPSEAVSLKRSIGALTKYTGNQSDDSIINKALQSAYSKTKIAIEKQIPGIKDLNERYGNLLSAEVATKYRNEIISRQNLVGFTAKNVGATAGIVTAMLQGGSVTPTAALAAIAPGALGSLLGSTGAKTRIAKELLSASPELRKQIFNSESPIAYMLKGAFAKEFASLFGED